MNNNLTIQGAAFMRIDKTGGTLQSYQQVVSGNVSYGGVLIITNVTSDTTSLALGDTFQLFNVTGTKTGNFSSITGTPDTELSYSFNLSNGVLSKRKMRARFRRRAAIEPLIGHLKVQYRPASMQQMMRYGAANLSITHKFGGESKAEWDVIQSG